MKAVLANPLVKDIARSHNASAAQVATIQLTRKSFSQAALLSLDPYGRRVAHASGNYDLVNGLQVGFAWVAQLPAVLTTASNSVEYDTEDLASTGLKLSPNDIKRLNAYNSTDIPPAPAPTPS